MSKRRYSSPARAAAADRNKTAVAAAAAQLLNEKGSGALSLAAVAKAAGVTRLTVYNQFGSRRGLLEAVFDERARAGGLGRIAKAMSLAEPDAALDRLIEIFCDFWSFDGAVGQLHAAAAADPEFAQALSERNERRRTALTLLVGRLRPDAPDAAARDLVDLLFALTSYAMFDLLRVGGRNAAAICALIRATAAAAAGRAARP